MELCHTWSLSSIVLMAFRCTVRQPVSVKRDSMRLLFLSTYRHTGEGSHAAASDALGFGVTCSDALVYGLRQHGVTVDVIGSTADRRTVWIGEVLARFEDAIHSGGYDAVLAFHAFWPFT